MIGKINDFVLLKELGYGAFGDVYLCEKDESRYAIKVFKTLWEEVLNEEVTH